MDKKKKYVSDPFEAVPSGGWAYVFIYGLYKKGFPFHDLLGKSKFLGDAVLPNYQLRDFGLYPLIVKKKGSRVYGEVFRVSRDTLDALDLSQVIAYSTRRHEAEVITSSNGNSEHRTVWVYTLEDNDSSIAECSVPVEDGQWPLTALKDQYVVMRRELYLHKMRRNAKV